MLDDLLLTPAYYAHVREVAGASLAEHPPDSETNAKYYGNDQYLVQVLYRYELQ